MQNLSAIESMCGVMELRTRVYGACDVQRSVPTGNLHAKEITDLHEGITSVG